MPQSCSRKILCVDDDPDDRHLLAMAVQKADPNMEVIEKHNGVEALDYLKLAKEESDLPCLIVLDINMPMMDGKQTLVKIKSDPELKHLPVVMFSTTSNPLDKELFRRQGVELVTKPRDIATMNSAVVKLLTHCA